MKKFTIFTAALALLATVSCMKETLAPETTEGDGVSFVASREDFDATTRTQLVDGCKVEWKAGDQIALFNTNGTSYTETGLPTTDKWRRCFPFNTQSNGSSAKFVINSTDNSAKAEGAQPYIFLYPYDWSYLSYMDSDHMMCRFWLTDQAATLGSFDPKYAPAVAKSQTLDEKVVFKNLLPLLKFTVPASLDGRITKITVTGNNNEFVAGNMICDYTGDTPVVKVFSEFKPEYNYKGGNKTVALNSTAGMAAGNYYLALAPKTYSKGLKVTVTYKDNKTSTRSSSASVDLKSGVIYDMGNVGAENYDGPGVALPYVFSLFAKAGNGNTPKYVSTPEVVVNVGAKLPLTDAATGAVFDAKVNGPAAVYWSNAWPGYDNVCGSYFTTQESAGTNHNESYFLLTAPLRTALPKKFRVSFGFMADKNDAIRDWMVQYSKNGSDWCNGPTYQIALKAKYYSLEIASELSFCAGDMLYLRWIPVGKIGCSGNETTGMLKDTRVQLLSGVAITDVVSPDSNASGNVYAEDFDRISGGVDYRHAGQTNGIEKLGLLTEISGEKIENWTSVQKNDLSGSNVVARPGYVQIGYATYKDDNRNCNASNTTNYVGSLVTPVLTSASGTLSLSFKAMCFLSPLTGRASTNWAPVADVTEIVVKIKGAGSFSASDESVKSITLNGISTSKFDKKALTIYNSDATTQIEFTSTAVSGKGTRWFIDDICVNK